MLSLFSGIKSSYFNTSAEYSGKSNKKLPLFLKTLYSSLYFNGSLKILTNTRCPNLLENPIKCLFSEI